MRIVVARTCVETLTQSTLTAKQRTASLVPTFIHNHLYERPGVSLHSAYSFLISRQYYNLFIDTQGKSNYVEEKMTNNHKTDYDRAFMFDSINIVDGWKIVHAIHSYNY